MKLPKAYLILILSIVVILTLWFVSVYDRLEPSSGGAGVVSKILDPALPDVGRTPVIQSKPLHDGDGFFVQCIATDYRLEETDRGFVVKLEESAGDLRSGVPDVPEIVTTFKLKEGQRAQFVAQKLVGESLGHMQIANKATSTRVVDGAHVKLKKSYEPDAMLVHQDEFWPSQPVRIEEAYIGRQKIARVAFSPFQYNPVTKELMHIPVIEGDLIFVEDEQRFGLKKASTASAIAENPLTQGDCGCSERLVRAEDYLPPMTGNPGDFDMRRAGLEVDACTKIAVHETGIHKVTGQALVDAGVDAALLVGANIRMYNFENQIPVYVSTQGLFGGTDFILLYGEKFEGNYEEVNYYWLGFGAGQNQMLERDATWIAGASEVFASCQQQTVSDQGFFFNQNVITDPRYDGWFYGLAADNPAFKDVFLTVDQSDHAVSGTQVDVDFTLKGFTTVSGGGICNTQDDHGVALVPALGGAPLCSVNFDGLSYVDRSAQFPVTRLDSSGQTALQVLTTNPLKANCTSFFDLVQVDMVRFRFNRALYAFNDRLAFAGESGLKKYRVKGVSGSGPAWLFDVSDPSNPQRLTQFSVVPTNGSYTVEFSENLAFAPCYAFAGNDDVISISSSHISTVVWRNLSDVERQIDYVMIFSEPFYSEGLKLLEHRAQSGLQVLGVSLEEVANEFGYGIKDVRSIKQFLGYAFHHWSTTNLPKIVMVGDASQDPQNVNDPSIDHMFTPFGNGRFTYTSIDPWFAMVNGADNVADIAVGRIPVNTAQELSRYINKVLLYEPAIAANPPWASRAHFVADNEFPQNDGSFPPSSSSEFHTSSDLIADTIFPFPPQNKTKSYLSLSGDNSEGSANAGAVRSSLLQALNSTGLYAMHYEGHGAVTQWTDENVFDIDDVSNSVNNSIWPIIGVFTCNNGLFQNPAKSCMIEELLRLDMKGSIASVAPTSLALPNVSFIIAREFYNALLNNQYVSGINGADFIYETRPYKTIGEAYLNGLSAAWYFFGGSGTQELSIYSLFGDPATVVKP